MGGYLAGIFDAGGSLSQTSIIRISRFPTSNDGRRVYERAYNAAVRFGFIGPWRAPRPW